MTSTTKRFLTYTLGALLLLGSFGCSSNDDEVKLMGAGATFPYPVYAKMFDEYYKEFGVKTNYQSIGSGGGIRQLVNKTVDFGATDAFMKDKELHEISEKIIHIPVCLGAVALTFNLPGIDSINLSSDVIADIFLGTIKKWNDARIQKLNPGVTMPKMEIVTVHRSDGSGTTFIFTDYLSKISPIWLEKVGRSKAVNWPNGLGGKGNAGVAGYLQQTPGSIGYIAHTYAIQNRMNVAKVKNKKGFYIEPSLDAVSYASNTDMPSDTRASITDTSAENGYPISGFTWIITYQDQSFNSRTINQALETKKLLTWMVTDGQRFIEPLNYAKLTESTREKALSIINSLTYKGELLTQ